MQALPVIGFTGKGSGPCFAMYSATTGTRSAELTATTMGRWVWRMIATMQGLMWRT